MSMSMKSLSLGLIIVLAILGISSFASAVPEVPYHVFYGTATIDGVNVSSGTPITAYLQNSTDFYVGGDTLVTPQGNYSLLITNVTGSEINMSVIFYINGFKAIENSTYESGGDNNINLTVVLPPTQPTLIAPSDNSYVITKSIYFNWSDSSDENNNLQGYVLQISDAEDFSNIVLTQNVIDSNYTLNSTQILPDGVYYFRAIATDGYSNIASDANNFTLDTKLPYVISSAITEGKNVNSIIYFSPNDSDAIYNTVNFSVNFSEMIKKNGIFSIINSTGGEVKSFDQNTFTTLVSKRWDGIKSGSTIYAPDGTYSLNATFTDQAGNTNSTIIGTVVVDKTSPAVSYSANTAPNNFYSSDNSIFIELNVFDANEDSVTFYLKNSTGDIINQITHPAGTRNITFSGLSDGRYEYYAEVNDVVEHKSSSEIRNITIDTVAPVISFTAETPANNSFSDADSIYVKVGITEENEQDVTFTLYNSTGGVINQTTLPVNSRSINFTNLASNTDYSFSVLATDLAGNSASTETRKITLDNIPPTIDYGILTLANNSYKNQDWVFIDVVMSDANLQDVQYNVQYQIGNESQGISTSILSPSNTTHKFTLLDSNEEYTYFVTVNDKAGHFVNTNPRKITLDSTLPALSQFISSDSDLISPNTLQQVFTVNLVEKNLKNVTLNRTQMNSAGGNVYSLSTTPLALGCSAEGNCNLAVVVDDLAGNTNSIQLVVFIDNNAPSITGESALTPQGNAIVYNNDSVYLNATINEPLTEISSVWLEGNWTGAMQNISLANSGNGKYSYLIGKELLEDGENIQWRYFANDSAGNVAVGNLNTLVITNRNPEFTGTIPDMTFIEDGNAQKFYIRNYFSDADMLDGNDDSITFTPATLSNFNGFGGLWQINYSDGNITIKPDINFNGTVSVILTATDKFGLSANSNAFIINVIGQNEAPTGYFTFNEIKFAEDTYNDTIDLDDYFRDEDGSIVKYTATKYDDAENVSIKIDDITHVVNISAAKNWNGVGRIYFTAFDNADGFGNSNNGLVVNVTPVNDAPELIAIPMQTTEEDSGIKSISLDGFASDPETLSSLLKYFVVGENESQVNCSISADGTGMDYKPLANWNGIASCKIRVSDNELNSSDLEIKLNITSILDAPQITSGPITTAVQDTPYKYKLAVSDGDLVTGESFTYKLLKKPQDANSEFGIMSVDSQGEIVWIPSKHAVENESKFNPIIVQVTDSAGLKSNQSFNVNVVDVNDAPSLNSIPQQNINEDSGNHEADLKLYANDIETSPSDLLYYVVDENSSRVNCEITSQKTLQYAPALDWFGISECKLRVSDGLLNSSDIVVKINVSNVPDTPVITSSPKLNGKQGELYEYQLTVSDGDSWAGESFTYSLLKKPQDANSEFGIMSINSDGEIKWVPTKHAIGNESKFNPIIAQVTDSSGLKSNQSFNVNVVDVNDAPTLSQIPQQNINEDSGNHEANLKLYANDIETSPSDLLYYVVDENSSRVNCEITSQKTLQYAPALDWFGISECKLRVSDGLLNSSDIFVKINVSNVPDTPIITSSPKLNGKQGELYEYQLTVSDGDSWAGESFTYSLLKKPQDVDEKFGNMVIDSSGKITWIPTDAAANQENQYNPVSVKVVDSSGLNVSQSWDVAIDDVNDVPSRFVLKEPENNSQIVNSFTKLEWDKSHDNEQGDVSSYKIFLSANESNISQSQIASITNGNAEFTINNLENSKTYYWYVVAVDNQGAERRSDDIFRFSTVLEPLSINGISIDVDGVSQDIKDIDVKPGSNLKFRINAKNLLSSVKIDDVIATVTIFGIDDDEDMETESEAFDLNPLATKDIELEIKIPTFVDENTYKVEIILNGKDENSVNRMSKLELSLDVKKDKQSVVVSEIKINPSETNSNSLVNISLKITNTGSEKAVINVSAINSELNINSIKDRIEINKLEDSIIAINNIQIPLKISAKDYPIIVKAVFANGNLIDQKTLTLKIINQAPVLVSQIPDVEWDEDVKNDAINLSKYFSDADENPLAFSASSVENISVQISNGIVTLTPVKDFNGVKEIIFSASDGTNTTKSNAVKLTVKNVNDAPRIKSYKPAEGKLLISELDSIEFTQESEDVDIDDVISVKWIVSSGSSSVSESITTPSLTFSNSKKGDYKIKLSIEDKAHLSDNRSWNVIVTNKPVSSKFTGTITQITDDKLDKAENVNIVETNGVIDFSGQVLNLTNVVDLDNNIIISKGVVGINTIKYPKLNKPARITLKGLGLSGEPILYYSEGFGVSGNKECPKDLCTNRVYNSADGSLSFDVIHFSTYFVNVVNNPPKANASNDIESETGMLVTLDGSKSSDIDGDSLNYTWTQTSGPSVSMSNNKAVNPSFTPSTAGDYVFQLVVNDGSIDSAPDSVNVKIKQSTLGSVLDITSVKLTSDGKDSELKPGEELKVKVDIDNKGDFDINDITLKVEFRDSSGRNLKDDDGDKIEEESNFDLDSGDDEGDLDKDDVTFTFDMPFDVDDNDEYFVYVTAEGEASNDSTKLFSDIDTGESIKFSRERHEINIIRAEISPINVICERQVTASVSLRNIGRDDEEGKITIENSALGIMQSEEFTLDSNAGDDDNLLRKTYSFKIPDSVEPGNYQIPINVVYGDGRETQSAELQLSVEGCERKVVEKKPLQDDVSVSVLPRIPSTTIETDKEPVRKKPVTVDFRDTDEYLMLLGFTAVIIIFVIIGLLAFAASGRRRHRR